jgi:threonine aldolase
MAEAVVGDDVYDEDPTVNRLQELAAERLGKEAGLFVASGTMGNIVALLTHGGRGDEVILGDLSHTFLYEGGATAGLAGIHPHVLKNEPNGTLPIEAIEAAIRGDNIHFPRTRLICLENTHNRCGGSVISPEYCARVADLARSRGIAVHLDGARLFNASVALRVPLAELTANVDSVMICLSKGLGAPVGSVLCGTRDFIARAKRMRKIVGGGMRQAGIIAAAGIYAMENNVDRLAKDHENARRLADGISAIDGLTLKGKNKSTQPVQTNLVYFSVEVPSLDARELSQRLRARGVLANPLGGADQMRMVTHLDVTGEDITTAISSIRESMRGT